MTPNADSGGGLTGSAQPVRPAAAPTPNADYAGTPPFPPGDWCANCGDAWADSHQCAKHNHSKAEVRPEGDCPRCDVHHRTVRMRALAIARERGLLPPNGSSGADR